VRTFIAKMKEKIALQTKKSRRAKVYQPGSFVLPRAYVIYAIIFAGFSLLSIRAILIHLYPASSQSLSKIANQQYRQELTLSRYRGTIFDRRKEPLAIQPKQR
jgi:cell division protein FtsI/penicillin-binding protein 2